MMDCIIVDDDVLTRMELQQIVQKVPFLHLVGTSKTTTEAFQLITFYGLGSKQLGSSAAFRTQSRP